MTDNCFYAQVALATGESVFEISRRGFHAAMPMEVQFDPEPGLPTQRDWPSPSGGDGDADLVDLGAYGIDWDEILSGPARDPGRGSRRRTRASSSLQGSGKTGQRMGGER